MPYAITISDRADRQLRAMPARDRRVIEDGIFDRLSDRPTEPTRAVKRLRPNPVAAFELRLGDLRVLYTVTGSDVGVVLIGRKVGNALLIDGEKFHEHDSNPGEPAAP